MLMLWTVSSCMFRSQQFVASGNGWFWVAAASALGFESTTSTMSTNRRSTGKAAAAFSWIFTVASWWIFILASSWIFTLLRSNSPGTSSLPCTDEGTKLPAASMDWVSANILDWPSGQVSCFTTSRVGGECDCLTCLTGPRSRRMRASPWRQDDGFMSKQQQQHQHTSNGSLQQFTSKTCNLTISFVNSSIQYVLLLNTTLAPNFPK